MRGIARVLQHQLLLLVLVTTLSRVSRDAAAVLMTSVRYNRCLQIAAVPEGKLEDVEPELMDYLKETTLPGFDEQFAGLEL